MTALNNTVLRCIDMPGDQHITAVSVQGGVRPAAERAVQLRRQHVAWGRAASTSRMTQHRPHGVAGLLHRPPTWPSSFYDLRPVTGKVTHWAYSGGTPVGAHQRFYDVIVGGAYPKIGPAATAWKTWYDPKNQITS